MPIYSYAELKGKIKVGDKVRAVVGRANPCHQLVCYPSMSPGVIRRITAVEDECFAINTCEHTYDEDTFLELLTEEKTLDTVDVGDVVVDEKGEERTILDTSKNGVVLFLSQVDSMTQSNEWIGPIYTRQELKDKRATVKQSTSAPAPKEMTLEEVSKALGYPVKIVE